uniref:Sulfotransferase domain-containing protein n=1 Tax=Amblyomma maculatum TaxID=34609 RepID=G3MQW3_AMBMU
MGAKRPHFQLIDGVPRGPNLNPQVFRESLKFRARRGDVLESTYPKCGTKWVQYIIQLILKEGKPILSYEDYFSNMRSVEYTNDQDWQATLPLRTFITHQPLIAETMSPEAKYVYIARNPWDVCLSFFDMVRDLSVYRFRDGTFDDFLDAFLAGDFGFGSYFEHVASGYVLKDKPNVFFETYEELKKDTRGTVLRLARFLGEQYSRKLEDESNGLLDTLLERSSPQHMRKVMVVRMQNESKTGWYAQAKANNLTSGRGYQGDETKYTVVNTARVGGWKEAYTPYQLLRLEERIQAEGEKASFMSLWKDMREEAIALCKIRSKEFRC